MKKAEIGHSETIKGAKKSGPPKRPLTSFTAHQNRTITPTLAAP
jgi:hypothetical protein